MMVVLGMKIKMEGESIEERAKNHVNDDGKFAMDLVTHDNSRMETLNPFESGFSSDSNATTSCDLSLKGNSANNESRKVKLSFSVDRLLSADKSVIDKEKSCPSRNSEADGNVVEKCCDQMFSCCTQPNCSVSGRECSDRHFDCLNYKICQSSSLNSNDIQKKISSPNPNEMLMSMQCIDFSNKSILRPTPVRALGGSNCDNAPPPPLPPSQSTTTTTCLPFSALAASSLMRLHQHQQRLTFPHNLAYPSLAPLLGATSPTLSGLKPLQQSSSPLSHMAFSLQAATANRFSTAKLTSSLIDIPITSALHQFSMHHHHQQQQQHSQQQHLHHFQQVQHPQHHHLHHHPHPNQLTQQQQATFVQHLSPLANGNLSNLLQSNGNSSNTNNNNNSNGNGSSNSNNNNSNNNNSSNNNSNNNSNTTTNSNGKRKRSWSRAVFSNLQRKGLEIQFQQQKYITKPDRRKLAARLNLTDAQVKVWFQNRRMKWRHTRENLKSGQEKLPNSSNGSKGGTSNAGSGDKVTGTASSATASLECERELIYSSDCSNLTMTTSENDEDMGEIDVVE